MRLAAYLPPVLIGLAVGVVLMGRINQSSGRDWRVGEPLQSETIDGAQIRDLIGGNGFLLVMDPADCFGCYTELSQWLAASHRIDADSTVLLLLTRLPSEREADDLARARVGDYQILERGIPMESPSVIRIQGGLIRAIQHVDSVTFPREREAVMEGDRVP